MATQTLLYGSVTAFTLTGASLAANACREGTIVANSSNLFIDMELSGSITLGAAASTGDAYILLSSSDGTTISSPASGADAGIVITGLGAFLPSLETLQIGMTVPTTDLVFLMKLSCRGLAAGAVVKFNNIYVAQAFGGNIPIGGWAPVLVNCTGQALSASASLFDYTGLKYTIG